MEGDKEKKWSDGWSQEDHKENKDNETEGNGNDGQKENEENTAREERNEELFKELYKFFKPEFLNRVDDTVTFNKLSKADIAAITRKEMDTLVERLKGQEYYFEYGNDVVLKIVKEGSDDQFGARPIKRYISKNIENLIVDNVLDEKIEKNNHYEIVIENDKFEIIDEVVV